MTTEKLYHQEGDERREYTDAEYAQHAKDIADALAAEAIKTEADAKAASDKAAAIGKLELLGLTVDDLKALGF